ncbi:hypothetical protein [Halobellus captivus]|uniref:hypothetical protein n=1 Tax=Halobellus captivus TaxID=2592614 RepID=UPI0011A7738D|nr:hypothetical protein [Halobellus captivus]
MNLPTGKLLALVTIVAALGIVTATGAFTTVSAERTASVTVAGDDSALLQIQPTDGVNGEGAYATTSNGQFQIDFSQQGDVNNQAATDIRDVFTITNQGTQNVSISITDSYDDESAGNSDAVTFYNATVHGDISSNGGDGFEDGNVYLESGETVTVSIFIDTNGQTFEEGDQLIDNVVITAEAVES